MRPSAVHVFARVTLQSSAIAELAAGRQQDAADLSRSSIMRTAGGRDHLNLHVSLSAEDGRGRRIQTSGRDFGMGGPRRGTWHRWHGPPLPSDPDEANRIAQEHRVGLSDIEDGINQMLGRDATLHHPPRLAWENLIRALNEAGVTVTERDLIDAPLTIDITPEVQAELDRP